MKIQFLKENIEQNLQDAGCDKNQIKRFLEIRQNSDIDKQVLFLKCQRWKLMEKMHHVQKEIDCLDYFIFMLKKEKNGDGK